MAKWQPPIPAGALWSADAVKLGPALALLAWCYDAVRRDGTLTISIADVAGDLDVEYRTIKRYWADLRAGPFFCDITDHGKRGYEVRFCDDWIDWRVLNARQPRAVEGTKTALEDDQPSKPDEGTNVSPDDLQGPVKAPSRPDEGTDMALNTSAYKVLNTTVLAGIAADAQSAPPPPPTKAPRARKPKAEPDSPLEVREAIAKGSAIDLHTGLKGDIVQVNDAGRRLWRDMRQPDQTPDSFVMDIRYVGKWVRQTQYPYKDSEQRIPPAALIKFWPAAMDARKSRQRPATNGAHEPPRPIRTQAERAADAAALARALTEQQRGAS